MQPPCKLARGLQRPCSDAQTRMIDVSRAWDASGGRNSGAGWRHTAPTTAVWRPRRKPRRATGAYGRQIHSRRRTRGAGAQRSWRSRFDVLVFLGVKVTFKRQLAINGPGSGRWNQVLECCVGRTAGSKFRFPCKMTSMSGLWGQVWPTSLGVAILWGSFHSIFIAYLGRTIWVGRISGSSCFHSKEPQIWPRGFAAKALGQRHAVSHAPMQTNAPRGPVAAQLRAVFHGKPPNAPRPWP
jgi:hypothetical protein